MTALSPEVIAQQMAELLVDGRDVAIDGLGGFHLRVYREYRGRSPRTGTPVIVPRKVIPFFRTDPALGEAILFSRPAPLLRSAMLAEALDAPPEIVEAALAEWLAPKLARLIEGDAIVRVESLGTLVRVQPRDPNDPDDDDCDGQPDPTVPPPVLAFEPSEEWLALLAGPG
jgi:nucleoid DNA-binding protein